MPLSRLPETDR